MNQKSLLMALMLTLTLAAQAEARAPKMILGWLETTQLPGSSMRIKTKLDVGAKTSSMQATNIERFKRDGKPWIRFDFTDQDARNEQEHTVQLEGPLVRDVTIKRHGAANVTRPVVSLKFCLYKQLYRTEFSLTDREKFNYPILLGRSFLAKVALVDASQTFQTRPDCEGNTSVRVVN